jgi:8-oxo-dGTP diphosphatase
VRLYVNARAIIERETESGIEILLQIRSKPGEPERWELPGGQIDLFESVFAALEREIREETGLDLTLVHERKSRVLHQGAMAAVETFQPLFAYQTIDGPVDSLGFYFRCQVEGTVNEAGDAARKPTWRPRAELATALLERPDQFDWLTEAALKRYLNLGDD